MNEEEKYIGTMLDDRYEILEIIGEGGMAIVFRAYDLPHAFVIPVAFLCNDGGNGNVTEEVVSAAQKDGGGHHP